MGNKIVTRFAPSPTGFLHVGGVRTALYAWLLARQNQGKFILRIEDTDKEREVAGSIEHIKESLEWLGLTWDELYKQSERLDVYKKYAEKLIKDGQAYLDLGAIRFRIPEKKRWHWHDLVYGDLSAGEEALEDFILIKGDGYPTYNFAHIVDDIEMGVTHVMRGEEFISSVPKYLSLYQALGIEPPLYATLPVILGAEGKKKLSKRDGAKDLLEYRTDGYLPEAMVNFLALLGWNPGTDQEIFSREDLLKTFKIERVQKSGAQLSNEKLDWVNKEHLKLLPHAEVEKNILAQLPLEKRNPKLVPIILERISKWGDVRTMLDNDELDFFFEVPRIDSSKLPYKNSSSDTAKANLKKVVIALENIPEEQFTAAEVKSSIMTIANAEKNRGEVLHPVRYGLTGKDKSPDPFTIASILGKNETIARLKKPNI